MSVDVCRTWLVTGGCGFIGKNLVNLLLRSAQSVVVYDNFSVGNARDLISYLGDLGSSSNLKIIEGDVCDPTGVAIASKGVDVFVHLAGNTGVAPSVEDPMFDCQSNVVGTLNCLEAAKQEDVERFVFASSGAPAGEVTPPISENVVPRPVSPYGASKLAGEGYCSAFYRTFGLETVVLRFGNVYGPGSTHKSSVVAKFIRRALQGDVLEVYGDGSQTRDFIFVHDLLDAIVKASHAQSVGGEIFQVATSAETSVSELLDLVAPLFQEFGVDYQVAYSKPRLGDVSRNFSDTRKAKKLLGWQASTVLTDGLRATFLDLEKRFRGSV